MRPNHSAKGLGWGETKTMGEAQEAGEDPYEILRQAPEHLPQLMARAGRFYEGFLRLLFA